MPSIEIIEAGEDGYDISDDTAIVEEVQSPSISDPNATFLKSKTFKGLKDGYVFKKGDQGIGYYKDKGGNVSKKTVSKPKEQKPPVQKKIQPPSISEDNLELIHQHGQEDPHSIELTLQSCEKFNISSSNDIKIECVNESKKLFLSSSKWTNKVEIPLHYQVYQEKTQGWYNNGTLTVRLPIRL